VASGKDRIVTSVNSKPRIERIQSHELDKFEGYFHALTRVLINSPEFDLVCFRLNAPDVTRIEIVRTAFPRFEGDRLDWEKECDPTEARKVIDSKL
jgi:hypothetical protein